MAKTHRSALAASLASAAASSIQKLAGARPHILMASSCTETNAGSLAHAPSMLSLLNRHLPGAEVTLWAFNQFGAESRALFRRWFPGLNIVQGAYGGQDDPSTAPALRAAVQSCDFLLQGSGAGFNACSGFRKIVDETGKPFGVYSIGFPGHEAIPFINRAAFAYFRDSPSVDAARAAGLRGTHTGFAPDAVFACTMRDDAAADAYIASVGLKRGAFLCCIPGLRHTPRWRLQGRDPQGPERRLEQRNLSKQEQDHAPLRETICAIVRETDRSVLICPENATQMAVGKEVLYDRLPDDVKARTVWRSDFWQTDLALGVCCASCALFGLEMHLPVACIGNGIPAVVCRFQEQTTKSLMWRDVGLSDWLLDFDTQRGREELKPRVMQIVRDLDAARAYAAQARSRVRDLHEKTMATVSAAVSR